MLESVVSMARPEVNITDDSFDPASAHRYRLLLQITDESLTVTILNQSGSKFILLRDYQFPKAEAHAKLDEIISSGEYIANVKYKSVMVSVASPITTLVPAPLFDLNDRRKMLEFNHALKPGDVIFSNYVRAFDVYNVFAIPESLNELLKSAFGSFTILHAATPFMEGVHIEYKNSSMPGLFVNVRKKSFELMAANGKQLLYYNSFGYEAPEDFIYYILFAAEQLRLNPELNPLTLSGNIQKGSAEYAMLYKYFRQVSFADLPEQYNYHYDIEKLPSHTYFSVFSQALCES